MRTAFLTACGCGLAVALAVLAFDRAGHFHSGTWPHSIFAALGALGVGTCVALFFSGCVFAIEKAIE